MLNEQLRAWRALGRVLVHTAGRAALQRALPLYLAVALAAAVIFGKNGLSPMTVAALSARSIPFRLAIYAGWSLASLPAIKALLATESTFFLRALPIPRARLFVLSAILLLSAELPWACLWLAAGGVALGVAAALMALALSALALCQAKPSTLLTGAALGGALLFAPAPYGLLVIAVPCAAFSLTEVWIHAPELPRPRARAWVRGPALLALTLSHLVVLRRTAAAQLLRAAGFCAVALGVGIVVIHNRGYANAGELRVNALMIAVLPLAFGIAGIAGPILRTEAELGWLTAACGTPWLTRQSAVSLASASIAAGLCLGLSLGLTALLPLGAGERAVIVGQVILAGILLSPMILFVARWAVRDSGRDGMRLLAGIGGGSILLMFSLALFDTRALLLWGPLAFMAAFRRANGERSFRPGSSPPRPEPAKGDSAC